MKKTSRQADRKTRPKNTEGMVALKKRLVDERLSVVREACEHLVAEGVRVSHAAVADKSGIPRKTLERAPYSTLIARYREPEPSPGQQSPEVDMLRKEVEYWRSVAEKYRVENANLLTLLIERGIDPGSSR